MRRWRSRSTSPAASWGSLPNLCTSWTRWRTREDVMSWIFEWWRTKVRVCSWQSSKVVEQSYSWLLTRSRNPRARDSNISRFELVVKLDYMIQSLDCKLLKYKLAFVVFLWPWSVLRHYIKQCTQIISNCYMGTILFTYRVYMYQILHISHQYQSHKLQNLIIFTSQCCRVNVCELCEWSVY